MISTANSMTAAARPDQRLATVPEACAYAKMGRSKLYGKIRGGDIKAFKRGTQTLVDLDSIDALNARTLVPIPARPV